MCRRGNGDLRLPVPSCSSRWGPRMICGVDDEAVALHCYDEPVHSSWRGTGTDDQQHGQQQQYADTSAEDHIGGFF